MTGQPAGIRLYSCHAAISACVQTNLSCVTGSSFFILPLPSHSFNCHTSHSFISILKMQLQQPHRRQRSFKQRRTLFSIPLFLDYPFEKNPVILYLSISTHTVQYQHDTRQHCPHFLFLTSLFQRSPNPLPYHLLHSCSCQVEGTGGTAIVLVPSRNCRFFWVFFQVRHLHYGLTYVGAVSMQSTFNGMTSGLMVDIFSHCFSQGFVATGAGSEKSPLLGERWWKCRERNSTHFSWQSRSGAMGAHIPAPKFAHFVLLRNELPTMDATLRSLCRSDLLARNRQRCRVGCSP